MVNMKTAKEYAQLVQRLTDENLWDDEKEKNPHADLCPFCGFDLDNCDVFLVMLNKHPDCSPEECLRFAKSYGWSEEHPKRFSKRLGIYDSHRDETVYFICPQCEERLPE
jgi:hypothetical protein